jgi:hypothetical protein
MLEKLWNASSVFASLILLEEVCVLLRTDNCRKTGQLLVSNNNTAFSLYIAAKIKCVPVLNWALHRGDMGYGYIDPRLLVFGTSWR